MLLYLHGEPSKRETVGSLKARAGPVSVDTKADPPRSTAPIHSTQTHTHTHTQELEHLINSSSSSFSSLPLLLLLYTSLICYFTFFVVLFCFQRVFFSLLSLSLSNGLVNERLHWLLAQKATRSNVGRSSCVLYSLMRCDRA